ncbi:MAG: SLC13 family permease, partial [Lachnospiraceae bacterium]|nr:SLC13 family permease [Lachnospiraceae bacterium]
VTIELAELLEFQPVPLILAEVFCANLGGSATMCGDPPNIIIGTSLGLTFFDFLGNTGIIALICLVVVIPYFYLIFRKQLAPASGKSVEELAAKVPDPKSAITDMKHFYLSWCIFGLAVVLLVTHAQTGLTVAFIGCLIAGITLVSYGKRIPEILKDVDYKTLLFFIGLFIVVGGLEQTGVLTLIANWIEKVSGGDAKIMVAIIIWVSAVASAFIDNIPFSATMVPVIQSLAATSGVDLSVLAWALSMGTDIGGSGTPIGASANVVGISTAERNGYAVTWGKYLKANAPATVLVIALAMVIIFVRYGLT